MNSKKIVFIGEFLLSFPGGAEKSIFNELLKISRKRDVVAYTFDSLFQKGVFREKAVTISNFGLKKRLIFFRFISIYFLNRSFLYKQLELIKNELKACDYVLTQSLIAPIVADFCLKNGIKYHYYIRDEVNLNIFNNYWNGSKRIFKVVKDLIEVPFIYKYKKMNKTALVKADNIIANSMFIKRLLKKKFGLGSVVVYPQIDVSEFKKIKINKSDQKYITFIGGSNAMKGSDIALKIAERLPNKKFLFVGPYKKIDVRKNITFVPWQKDVLNVYKKSKIIIMPSRWMEAYGRVPVEAAALDIPVITSNRGGLPESNKRKDLIINDLENLNEWVYNIERLTKC